ncbi:chromate transporter [Celerinatantimonas yamalensis]|uniref:Chromate transporter n=1 Tax=Celerinatantimonas yamalensis TaxID=559956 RepID=A0ABW9G8W2_9GAMM
MILMISLALVFAQLSLMAFGGGNTILPEMQHQVVQVHHWLTAQQFSTLFAMAQAAPGPNMMIVPLIGWQVAGIKGLMVTSAAKFIPSSCLTLLTQHFWQRFQYAPWRTRLQQALKPVTVGLVFASAILIAKPNASHWQLIIIMMLVTKLSYRYQMHPLWLLAGGSMAGVLCLS